MLNYKMANMAVSHGIEMYTELPTNRQKYIDSIKNSLQ